MAGIVNINNGYNINPKKIVSNLSFETGQQFSGRIVSAENDSKEVIVKLADGWQFPAVLEKPLENMPEGLVKFQVDGYVEGKLQIKLVSNSNGKEDKEDNSIESALRDQNISLDKDEFSLLERMVRHEIPLTRENISQIKTLVDFKESMTKEDGYEDRFIEKYLQSKNIDLNSDKAQDIRKELKEFFSQLKKLSSDDIMLFFENNIEMNKDNIQSFNKIFKTPLGLFDDIKNVEYKFEELTASQEIIEPINEEKSPKTININRNQGISGEALNGNGEINDLDKQPLQNNISSKMEAATINQQDDIKKQNIVKEFIGDEISKFIFNKEENKEVNNFKYNNRELLDKTMDIKNEKIIETEDQNLMGNTIIGDHSGEDKINSISKQFVKNIYEKEYSFGSNLEKFLKEKNIDIRSDEGRDIVKEVKSFINSVKSEEIPSEKNLNTVKELLWKIKDQLVDLSNKTQNKIELNEKQVLLKDNSLLVKEQLTEKSQQLKEIVQKLMANKDELKPEIFNKVIESIKENINDFKVFNSISNQYYYMDLPVNINQNQYECKLIIKDERGKGKQIDPKNIKITASVRTVNMGIIDAYIRVKNGNMNVELKSDEKWMKILEIGKDKIIDRLNNLGYNSYMSVGRREIEMNIVNCREFFNDHNINTINRMV